MADFTINTYSANVKLLLVEPLLNEGKLDGADQILDSTEEEEKSGFDTLVDVVYLYIGLGCPEKDT